MRFAKLCFLCILPAMALVVLPHGFSQAPSGSLDDPIIDSKMTEKEAFDGLDPDCPKPIRDRQKLIDVRYYGFDGKVHRGQLVIDAELINDIREVFEIILKQKFPIGSAIPISHPKFRKDGQWDDDLSMAANNTSAFNYRRIQGSKTLSNHAYGRAIDINPVQNPFIKGKEIQPAGARYNASAAGTLTPEHPIVQAFLSRGWKWGGAWKSMKDYQHFEKPVGAAAKDAADQPAWIKPPALRRGDTIMLVAPASPVEKDVVLRYAKQMEEAGFRVIVPKGLSRAERYLAGSDAERAAELNAAFRDPQVNAIFPCRGGFGLTRILDKLERSEERRVGKE